MVRVLLVDDHPLVREGLGRLLGRAGAKLVGWARTGEEGLKLAGELQPDLILWDLAMPGGGLAPLARLREVAPQARVVVLTALDDPLLAREAARAGAAGYLAKTCSPGELIQAIVACGRGGSHFPQLPRLSPREEELVRGLASGLSNRALADKLGISVKTVESHLEKLKRKLGCQSTAELRAWAMRRNPCQPPPGAVG
jgi:DNA-binding NarL/FixJ family response regulator